MKLKNTLAKPIALFIAISTWFALVLQFLISYPLYIAQGMSATYSLLRFFSYFTILTNILVALSITINFIFSATQAGKFFSDVRTKSAIALYIGIVGVIYNLVLRQLWNPQGWQLVADISLHSVIPFFYIVYWLFFVTKGKLEWKNALPWLIYPLAYLPWILIIGVTIKLYPYPFVDVSLIGYPRTFLNVTLFAGGFLLAGWLLIGIDKLMSRNKKITN
jgi:hypothetical protein